jgi:hypothetical protein
VAGKYGVAPMFDIYLLNSVDLSFPITGNITMNSQSPEEISKPNSQQYSTE